MLTNESPDLRKKKSQSELYRFKIGKIKFFFTTNTKLTRLGIDQMRRINHAVRKDQSIQVTARDTTSQKREAGQSFGIVVTDPYMTINPRFFAFVFVVTRLFGMYLLKLVYFPTHRSTSNHHQMRYILSINRVTKFSFDQTIGKLNYV